MSDWFFRGVINNCGNNLGLHSSVAMSVGFNSTEICLQLLLSTFSLIFLTLFSTQTFHILSVLLIHHKASNESVQQTVLLTTTSTDIALTTALTNLTVRGKTRDLFSELTSLYWTLPSI